MQRLLSAGHGSLWSLHVGSTISHCPHSRAGSRSLTGICKCPRALRLKRIKGSSTGILFHLHLLALTHSHLISRRVYFLINVFSISFLTWKILLYIFGRAFQKEIYRFIPHYFRDFTQMLTGDMSWDISTRPQAKGDLQ